jgi:hypothetical protein
MLRTWDAAGRQTLGIDTRIAKFMGVATVGWDYTGGTKSGVIVDGRFTQYANVQPFVMVISGSIDVGGYMPQLTISGNTLTWNYTKDAAQTYTRPNTTFMYGIF